MRFLEVDLRVTIAVSEEIADPYYREDITNGLVGAVEGETVFSAPPPHGQREMLTAIAEDAVVKDWSWK